MPMVRARTGLEVTLVIAVIVALAGAGLVARQRTWQATEALRYDGDMKNGWAWGSRAAREGYVALYDRVVAESPDGKYGLDYLPLRLAAMTLWARERLAADPSTDGWRPAYDFNRPLLRLNTACEAMSAVGLGLIVFDRVRRDRRSPAGDRRPLAGVWVAVIAAAFAWLNPASIVSAHGRPTWDVWVTPFYVWSVLTATRNAWFAAGCVAGVGAMCKGQQLFAVPFLVLWPLLRWRWDAVARLLLGLAVSIAVVGSPWLVRAKIGPIAFVVGVGLLPVLVWAVVRRWPIRGRSMPAGWLRWLTPLAAFVAIVACVPLFGGSLNWLRVGLIYGADKFPDLEVGRTDSLGAILSKGYHWRPDDLVPTPIRLYAKMTISHLMMLLYALALPPIAWAAARYEKRGDRRFVLAMAAPWIVYFAVFPKMHERYLLWGATIACAGVAADYGMLALAAFFSLCSTAMSLAQMGQSAALRAYGGDGPAEPAATVWRWLEPTYPGLAWAVLLGTAVWLWATLAGALRRKERPLSPDGGFQ